MHAQVRGVRDLFRTKIMQKQLKTVKNYAKTASTRQKTRSDMSRSRETLETEQLDHRGSIPPSFEVNFVNLHGALGI